MKTVRADLALLLRPYLPGIVCLTGGGGKTTLLYALGRALGTLAAPAVCTTTTRIFPPAPEQCPTLLLGASLEEMEPVEKTNFFCAGRPSPTVLPKLLGFAPEAVDAYAGLRPERAILVEADGAACRPIKAPEAYEPVIPASTKAVVAVLGLSALNRPFNETTVFRSERTAEITGLQPGETLAPAPLARLFSEPHGLFQYAPPGAARFAFLNQADRPGAREAGVLLARAILRAAPEVRVLLGAAGKEGLCCTQILL